MCVGITIIKWDSTCHSQTHGTEPPVHFCCSHYISPCFLSTSPFHSLSLSCFLFLSLSLSLPPLSLCGCKTHVIWCPLRNILFLINLTFFHAKSCHSSYKLHQPFTDYFLRLPYSEMLEKRVFSLLGQPSSSYMHHFEAQKENWPFLKFTAPFQMAKVTETIFKNWVHWCGKFVASSPANWMTANWLGLAFLFLFRGLIQRERHGWVDWLGIIPL